MSVAIVVVSHSPALARAALDLAEVMIHDEHPPVAIAAGLSDGSLGTDATAIMQAVEDVHSPEGVAVLVDMGSAVLAAETALDLLDLDHVRIAAAPFVEGLTAALVRAALGGSLDEVVAAAEDAMDAKLVALGQQPAKAGTCVDEDAHTARARLVNASGLHARPSARLASLANGFDADIRLAPQGKPLVNAKSTMNLMALGAVQGDELLIQATGAQAEEALAVVVEFIAVGLGE